MHWQLQHASPRAQRQQQQQQQQPRRRQRRQQQQQQRRPVTPNSLAHLRRTGAGGAGAMGLGDFYYDDEEFIVSDESDDTGIML